MGWKHLAIGWAFIVLVLAAFGIWQWTYGEERRALRDLAPEARAALYQRTLENLRAVCGDAKPWGLELYCAHEARFAMQFEECDVACRELARAEQHRPSR
ncbi:MAG TPA: hypothetical protein VMR31_16755 [Myxococcota bacterium]|nr:hypothetical protein [Myxococcota bacterium]